jgi:hypothetical protein
MFALSPETFPADDIASKSDACRRGEFTANGRTFQLFGNETDTPPRWAIGPDRRRIVYLAMAPDPAEALQAARTRATQISLTKPPTYVLAVTDGHRRRIYQVSNAIPADDRLMTSMRDALEGRLPLMATFDAKSGETEFED